MIKSMVMALTVGVAVAVPVVVFAGDAGSGQSITNLLTQMSTNATVSGDAQLQSLSGDLTSKVEALIKSLGNNPDAASKVQSAVQSIQTGNGSDSLSALQKLSAAKLTPEQTKLVTDVRNVGSAYLVQKNFASLDGSQSDVAQIVSSLRKGQATTALPAIKRVSENAKLTQPQKDFLTSLAAKYTPGGSTAEEGLKKLKGLGL